MVRAIEALATPRTKRYCTDVASTEFLKDDGYHMDGKVLSSDDLVEMYGGWLDEYPILSIEDGFGEDDWRGWALHQGFGHASKRWATTSSSHNLNASLKALNWAANAMLVKVNQVGTIRDP